MFAIFFINIFIIGLVVIIHYETLLRISLHMPNLSIRPRYKILVGIFAALIAHIVEIWIFAFAYYKLTGTNTFGSIHGMESVNLLDCVYYSFVNYTSLGYGDMVPTGPIRFLSGLEALTGLVLITWTASFIFFQMQHYWEKD